MQGRTVSGTIPVTSTSSQVDADNLGSALVIEVRPPGNECSKDSAEWNMFDLS